MHQSDDKAVCRNCGRELIGKPYHLGGSAYLPGRKLTPAKANHFGGWVCSHSCDYRAELEQEESMPGHTGQRSLGVVRARQLREKWGEE
jgi:hypothetical protein